MARKLRIQYENALYHVINRGNYRQDVFASTGAAQAFETALFEACAQAGWILHAHVVMRNHFHLAIETPRANLVEGMHWLQSTFATRFNRLRQERGHLFQGRYQALLIEDTAALARVVDYIHLNPVRAGIVPVEQLAAFRWSSLRRLLKDDRPGMLRCADWLEQRGFDDSVVGRRGYVGYLQGLAQDEQEQKQLGFPTLSSGWAIGTDGWRRAMAKEHQHLALNPGLDAVELHELKHAAWEQALIDGLRDMGRQSEEARLAKGNSPWKIALAKRLRQSGAPYSWITRHLHMGKPSSVRVYLSTHNSI